MDPALLIPRPDEGFDGGGVEDKEGPEVKNEVKGGSLVVLEEISSVDHISDYESDQSDEALAAADQRVYVYL